jgi:hypothetical protein
MALRLGRETLLHFGSQLGVTVAGFVASFVIARVGGADVLGLLVGVDTILILPAVILRLVSL